MSKETNSTSAPAPAHKAKVCVVDPKHFQDAELEEAARCIREGKLVAFPTETVYGLGANALNADAVASIFVAKGRPQDNPLIVHVTDLEMVRKFVMNPIPEVAETLAKRFWPGPMTLILRRPPGGGPIPNCVTAGLDTVAIRVPVHPIAHKLIELAGVPIAAPSANLSGRPSPTLAKHCIDDISDRPNVAMIVDGGLCDYGVESTVIDPMGESVHANPPRPILLRPGGLTLEAVRQIYPTAEPFSAKVFGTAATIKPATPGLKYRHYSPKAPVVLFDPCNRKGAGLAVSAALCERLQKVAQKAHLIGVIQTHGPSKLPEAPESCKVITMVIGDEKTSSGLAEVERGVFNALRALDEKAPDVILVEGVAEEAQGLAIMNRLRKASGEVVSVKVDFC